MTGTRKRHICVLMRSAPHGSIRAQEGLEAVLMASAFEQHLSVILIDDAVLQLSRGQRPRRIGAKDFASAFKALEMYGVDEVLVDSEALAARALTAGDLMIPVCALATSELARVLDDADVVMSF